MGDEEVRLLAVYKKPTTNLDTSDINKILDLPRNTIIAGDLNTKKFIWNSKTTNQAGNELERFLDTRLDTIVAAPYTQTHYPDNPNHNPRHTRHNTDENWEHHIPYRKSGGITHFRLHPNSTQ